VTELVNTLVELVVVLTQLGTQLLYLLLQNALLVVWLAWALFGINWKRAWPVLAEGAWAPVVLLTILVPLVWASLFPTAFAGLGFVVIPNFWWQLIAVWLLVAATCFCGWLQGVLNYTPPEISTEPPADDHGHGHGHHH
jgi:hypothetical protein